MKNKKNNSYIEDKKHNHNMLNEIGWGSPASLDPKIYDMKDIVIPNRFDFGGDAEIIHRNYIEPKKRKIPNLFGLKKSKEGEDE